MSVSIVDVLIVAYDIVGLVCRELTFLYFFRMNRNQYCSYVLLIRKEVACSWTQFIHLLYKRENSCLRVNENP